MTPANPRQFAAKLWDDPILRDRSRLELGAVRLHSWILSFIAAMNGIMLSYHVVLTIHKRGSLWRPSTDDDRENERAPNRVQPTSTCVSHSGVLRKVFLQNNGRVSM